MDKEQMKNNKIGIFGIISFIISRISEFCTIYNEDKRVKEYAPIITDIALAIFLVVVVYYLLCVAVKFKESRNNKINYDELKQMVLEMKQQYEKFQENMELMEDSLAKRIKCPAHNTIFQYTSTDVTKITNQLLDEHPTANIRIICFGRNGYGDVIEHIKEKESKVKAEIIVYYPYGKECICRPTDRQDILQHIRRMLKSEVSVKVYATNIPPSIRACVISKSGQAIWGAVQSYRFEKRNDGELSLVKPKESLIPVCGEKTINKDFNGLIRCFNEEFEYLMNDCFDTKLVGDDVRFTPHRKRKRGL